MKKVILLVLLILMMTSCSQIVEESIDSEVAQSEAHYVFRDGNYVYLFNFSRMFRYDLKNNVFDHACIIPTCDHNAWSCPLYGIRYIAGYQDHYLYYVRHDKDYFGQVYAGYSMLDGTETVLLTTPDEEEAISHPIVYGTYLYLHYYRLIENGDASNPDDYKPTITRISLQGGEEEVLFTAETPRLLMSAIVNDRIVFVSNFNTIYSTDLNGENQKIIFEDESCLSFANTGIYYLDGYCYFRSVYRRDTLLTGTGYSYAKLLRVNMETGEVLQLFEEDIRDFLVTGDKIYYFKTELEYLYIPEDPNDVEAYVIRGHDGTLYSCDLDGSNERVCYQNESLRYSNLFNYTVIDDILYGSVNIYDEKTMKTTNPYFVKIDMKTGEYTQKGNLTDYIRFVGS